MPGRVIVLDGGEGAGKSTAISYIRDFLAGKGIDAVTTREPGGTPLSERLRDVIKSDEFDGMSADTETLLMFAARAEHLDKLIKPALNEGKWVISDRFTSATYAYQSAARKMGEDRIRSLENWVQGDLRPDMTIIMDLPVEVGMERAGNRGALDRFEREGNDFLQRVRSNFLEQATVCADRYALVDASQPLHEVRRNVLNVIEGVLRG